MERVKRLHQRSYVIDTLNSIFLRRDVCFSDIAEKFQDEGLSVPEIPYLLDKKIFRHQLAHYLKISHTFASAFFTTIAPPDWIKPFSYNLIVGTPEKTNSELDLSHPGIYLCDEAEDNLARAERLDKLLLVNDTMLVKLDGRKVGLCVRTSETPTRKILLRGSWYALLRNDQRNQLLDVDLSTTQTTTIPDAVWEFIRPLGKSATNVLPHDSLSLADTFVSRLRS